MSARLLKPTKHFRQMVEMVRFSTCESGTRAIKYGDWSGALRRGDPGFDEAVFELSYLSCAPEGDPQDPDNEEDDDE